MKFFIRNYNWPDGMEEAARNLSAGKHRHDVLEASIREIEDNPTIQSVAWGGAPNLNGVMELDAAFMNGDGLQLGAVAALSNFRHPVSIARALMEKQTHTFLAGAEAQIFARDLGFKEEETLHPDRKKEWEEQVRPLLSHNLSRMEIVRRLSKLNTACPHDTVVMIASDGEGLSTATSTPGWDFKHPGRVGDSPIPGAGFYVDSRVGGCVCTHTGEMSTRANTAGRVVTYMEMGKTPEQAVIMGVRDLAKLSGGVLGTLVIHAINKNGQAFVAAANTAEPIGYYYWNDELPAPELRWATNVSIPKHFTP